MMRFFANGSPRDCSFFTASFIPYVPKQGILMRLKWAKIVKKGRFSTNKSLNTVLCTVCWVFSHWLTDVQNCVEHFKQIVNSEFLSLHYLLCCLQSVTLSWLADYSRQLCIQHFVHGQIDLKTRSCCLSNYQWQSWHFIVLLTVSCVYVCICVTVLVQPLAAKTQ